MNDENEVNEINEVKEVSEIDEVNEINEVNKINEIKEINEVETTDGTEVVASSNAFSKVINIIFAPSKALYGIKKKPNIFLPIVIIVLIPFLYLLLWSRFEAEMILALENQMEIQGQELTSGIMNIAIITMKAAFVGSGIIVVLTSVLSGAYYFVCGKIAKSEVTYKQIMSLVYHIAVISSLPVLLNGLLSLLGMEVSLTLPITSLASLLPSSMEGTFIYGAAMIIEVFHIWAMVVMYMGLRIVANMSSKASMISVILLLLFGMLYTGGSLVLQDVLSNVG